jgi:(2R)-3-sulfolactate dehydrogenase (NADP+)
MSSPQAEVQLTLDQVGELALKALIAAKTSERNADSVTRSIVAAEADGLHSHGLMRLPAYCEHVLCGKVNGHAVPRVDQRASGAIDVDAACGFAHPAIDAGFQALVPAARDTGIAALAVRNSYNCGVVGHHVEHLAREGLIGVAFVNSPAAIAPWGGTRPLFGTNPIAFAAPRRNGDPLVIDQSSSVIARGEVMLKAREGKPIPDTWGLDSAGRPTTDPGAVLKGGSMAPSGGYKGVGLALMVEVLAAALTGASLSFNASSLADNEGGPPRIGQFFIAIDPAAFGGSAFPDHMDALCAAIAGQAGARLPGSRRMASRARTPQAGVRIGRKLYDDIASRATGLSFQK